jgi:LmbE family N-acetylglucosaminyl deacetylase
MFFYLIFIGIRYSGHLKKHVKTAVIVAHPDDETLWAGGSILMHHSWRCFIITLCRGDDPDRAPKFRNALEMLHAEGKMGSLDDGPEQFPLDENLIKTTILELLKERHFDLVITHDPAGEYTRHLRHEEISRAVIDLWCQEKIFTPELRTFAYEDGGRAYLPQPVQHASIVLPLPNEVWQKKYKIITEIYGFHDNSFEAQTTTTAEAFWQFKNPEAARLWLNKGGREP